MAKGLRSLAGSLYRSLAGNAARATPAPSSLVREADVRAAYRLLLGREPDADGWHNFGAMVGTVPTSDLVTAFMSSEEFRRTTMHQAVLRRERDDLQVVDIGDGLRLMVSANDLLNESLLHVAGYEAHLAAAIDRCLRPGMSFCAVGANVGYHVVRAAHRVGPSGRVFAFEAHPGNAQLVARNVALNGLDNVLVMAFAVSDRRTLLRYVAAQGTNGYVEPVDASHSADPDALQASLLLQSICLDDLLTLLAPIDVLQIDVEGSEGRALRGARALLTQCKPTIFSELCLGQLSRTSDMTGEDYLEGLRALGYRFSVLAFDGEVVEFGDAVAKVCAHARAQPTSHVDIRCAVAGS